MNTKFEVQGIEIKHKLISESDYISLTDIAKMKNDEAPNEVIRNWLRTRVTVEFLGVWETLNNPDFNPVEFDGFRKQAGLPSFTLSPQKWIETTNAIGIVSNAGKYGGTYAHSDIALEFANWISVEFRLYMIKEFKRYKIAEQAQLQWNARRELTKLNFHLHTDAIKEVIVPTLTEQQKTFIYQNETDVLNVALFGFTASEWRKEYPQEAEKGQNVRDFADIHQLLVLANMESYNAAMIKDGLKQNERIQKLNDMARYQLPILVQSNSSLLLGGIKKQPLL